MAVHSDVPIAIMWGEDGLVLYNDAYAPLAGSLHPHLLGSKVREGWPAFAEFHDRVLQVCLGGGRMRFKDHALTLDRNGRPEQIWANLDYSPLIGENGTPAGVIVIVAETTDRVLEARLSRAERDGLRSMFDQAPGFMAMLEGPDHVCTLNNAALIQLIGKRPIQGIPIRTAMPEIAGQGFFEILDQCFQTGDPITGAATPVQLQRRPGAAMETRFVDFVFQPIRGVAGDITGIFVQGSDVTGRVVIDAALRESEARFREIANAAPVLIWITDTTKAATWFNAPWLAFTGRSMEQEIGHGWLNSVHPDDLANCKTGFFSAFDRRQPFRIDYRLKRADGEWRYMFDTGVPRFKADGTFMGYIGSCVDVTEARLNEAELRRFTERLEARVILRTTELAAANRELLAEIAEREQVEDTLRQMQRLEAVGQVTSGVAHDFNNLLTIILGNIEFLERALDKAGITGKPRDRLNFMKEAADRGAKLTRQLLAFSRRQRLEAKPANLNTIIAAMHNLIQTSMGGSFQLDTDLDPDLWTALVDTTQIELVILNLAINGRDAMPSGGVLTVSTANVTLGEPERPDAPPAGDYVMVSVTDTGSGMAPDVLAKAYEPFFTTKPVGKGSGLGLAQVLGVAKQSGGGVRIDTDKGRGTSVKVYVPRSMERAEAEPAEKRHAEIHRLSGLSRNVLLVDDDDAVREISASILQELGCTVAEASSGRAALELLDGQVRFDGLVVDFAMPGMNGVELVREVNARYPDMPVLYVTGYADMSALDSVSEDCIVQKPFRDDQFITKVKVMLSTRRPVQTGPAPAARKRDRDTPAPDKASRPG